MSCEGRLLKVLAACYKWLVLVLVLLFYISLIQQILHFTEYFRRAVLGEPAELWQPSCPKGLVMMTLGTNIVFIATFLGRLRLYWRISCFSRAFFESTTSPCSAWTMCAANFYCVMWCFGGKWNVLKGASQMDFYYEKRHWGIWGVGGGGVE